MGVGVMKDGLGLMSDGRGIRAVWNPACLEVRLHASRTRGGVRRGLSKENGRRAGERSWPRRGAGRLRSRSTWLAPPNGRL